MGGHEVAGRKIPKVLTEWTSEDRRGELAVRWGIGRYDYIVEPGLYAVGQPGSDSPVLVTANYKLSFDVLRRELSGLDAFVLVLETMGINVWCAAGKGTFGTDELCRQVQGAGLESLVSHRRLVVPQLGAPGVAAHAVKERTGFRVTYGPVEARDLPTYLETKRATDAMRQKDFPLSERAALVPMEVVPAVKYALPLAAVLAAFAALLGPAATPIAGMVSHGLAVVVALAAAVLCGAVLTPVVLPWVPGRAFALKGALVAIFSGVPLTALTVWGLGGHPGWLWLDGVGLGGVVVALSSFLAMNFTGSSTFTSLSGVEQEMRVAVPLQALFGAAGLVTWGVSIALLR